MMLIGKIPAAEEDESAFAAGARPLTYIAGKKLILTEVLTVLAAFLAHFFGKPGDSGIYFPFFLLLPSIAGGITGIIYSAVKSHRDSRAETLPLTLLSVVNLITGIVFLPLAAVSSYHISDLVDYGMIALILFLVACLNPFVPLSIIVLWISLDRIVRLRSRRRRCKIPAVAYKHSSKLHDIELTRPGRHTVLARHTGKFDKEYSVLYRYETDSGSFYFSPVSINGAVYPESTDITYDPDYPEFFYITGGWDRLIRLYRKAAIIAAAVAALMLLPMFL